MHMGMVIFNGVATLFCMVALAMAILAGNWYMSVLNLVLLLANLYFAYIHYMAHKKMEILENERTRKTKS